MTLLRSLSVNLAELRRAQTRVGKGGFDLGMRNAEFEKREGRGGEIGYWGLDGSRALPRG